MAIPYIGAWPDFPPAVKTLTGQSWSNVIPVPKALAGSVPTSSVPVRTDIPGRDAAINTPPEGHPYSPSGITQLQGYLLLSSGPDDQIMNSAGGFLLYAGSPGMFSNAAPVASPIPPSAGDSGAPVGSPLPPSLNPPANNSAPLPNPHPFGPADNVPPVPI